MTPEQEKELHERRVSHSYGTDHQRRCRNVPTWRDDLELALAELSSTRAQLAEVTRERDEAREKAIEECIAKCDELRAESAKWAELAYIGGRDSSHAFNSGQSAGARSCAAAISNLLSQQHEADHG